MKTRFQWRTSFAACPRWAGGLLLAAALPGAWATDAVTANPARDPMQPSDPAHAAAPVPPMSTLAIPILAPARLATPGSTNWQQANAGVAQFPRGHMDILKWEAANPDKAFTSATQAKKRQP